jgi:hypothetical protein
MFCQSASLARRLTVLDSKKYFSTESHFGRFPENPVMPGMLMIGAHVDDAVDQQKRIAVRRRPVSCRLCGKPLLPGANGTAAMPRRGAWRRHQECDDEREH